MSPLISGALWVLLAGGVSIAVQAADAVLLAALLAPIDDEPETAEEREAVAEARADYAAGRAKTMGEVRRELLG